MKKYEYKSRNPQGKSVAGTVEAETESEAVQELRRRGLTVTSISGTGARKNLKKFQITLPSFSRNKRNSAFRGRISRKDLVPVSRQLATMFEAGIPLVEALEVIEEQAEVPALKAVIGDIASEVRQGKDFSTALSRHPRVFDDIFINMVRAGEASGQLDGVLDRLASHMEDAEELKGEIKGAMTYPVVSLFLIAVISTGLLVFVLPNFQSLFADMDAEMPALTLFVMGMSHFAQSHFMMLMLTAGLLYGGYKLAGKTSRGEMIRDWLVLRIPVFGPLIQKTALSRFSGTFATLIRSGVPILGALEIVKTTTGNVWYERAIADSAEAVRQGESLAAPLARSGQFPPMVTRMISIGEKSGSLEQLLEKVSQFYDREVRATVKQLTSLIEPFLIVIMGIIVGTMVIAMFMPLLSAFGAIGK
ncbi:MAG TPA: type II secretion system F family protein [Planctomycetes bacterium]|nr:type II secretion system F family protein [Planctomycetota bacterium]